MAKTHDICIGYSSKITNTATRQDIEIIVRRIRMAKTKVVILVSMIKASSINYCLIFHV